MVQLSNLSRAYVVMENLSDAAKAAGFNYTAIITPESGGELYFKVSDIGGELGKSFLRTLEDPPYDFIKRAEEFRAYWLGLMETAKASNAVRIAELKAELARLEGRA